MTCRVRHFLQLRFLTTTLASWWHLLVSQNKSGYIVRNGGLYREYVLLCIVRYNSCSVPMTPRFDTAGVDTIDVKTVR